nr:ATP synthase F0 subunit 8 [Drepanosurus hatanakai]BCW86842.1 ATP synthase F0 subunit 8 [Drepanosurus hatanakai]
MPQMAPLPWTTLLVTSVLIIILVMTMTYFIDQPIALKSNINTPRVSVNSWVW